MQKIQSFDWLHFKFNFCFLCFHSRGRFFRFHKDRENTRNLFTLAENNFGERKLSCIRLNFDEIFFAETKRAVMGGQYRSILPARLANQNTEFAAYCQLASLPYNKVCFMLSFSLSPIFLNDIYCFNERISVSYRSLRASTPL